MTSFGVSRTLTKKDYDTLVAALQNMSTRSERERGELIRAAFNVGENTAGQSQNPAPSSAEKPKLENPTENEDTEKKIEAHLENQRKTVRALISEMSPENLQKALDFVEEYSSLNWIPKIPGLEKLTEQQFRKYEPMVQGVVGGMFINDLQNLGYQIVFTGENQINVVSEKADKNDVILKINHNLQNSRTLANTLGAGLLYANNPSFRAYRL